MNDVKPVDGALLLCVDLQPVFLAAVSAGPEVLRRCQFVVAAARLLGIPTAFTEQVPSKLGGTEATLLALAAPAEVHAKELFSALAAGSPVRAALTSGRDIEHLILCGVETHICVFQTAVDALQAGTAVTVLSDAVSSRRAGDSRAALDALARAGAHVVPSETVFYTIVRGAHHPSFKAFTALVKSYG